MIMILVGLLWFSFWDKWELLVLKLKMELKLCKKWKIWMGKIEIFLLLLWILTCLLWMGGKLPGLLLSCLRWRRFLNFLRLLDIQLFRRMMILISAMIVGWYLICRSLRRIWCWSLWWRILWLLLRGNISNY